MFERTCLNAPSWNDRGTAYRGTDLFYGNPSRLTWVSGLRRGMKISKGEPIDSQVNTTKIITNPSVNRVSG